MLDVSIVIVSFNARVDLERCLQSLHDAPPARPHEILLVDNASADGSADAARRWPAVRVIETGANLGFSRGNNVGIRASSGTNLLLLNSDTIVPPGAIDTLLSQLDQHPDVAVVGPRLINGSGHAELFVRTSGWWRPFAELRQKRLASGDVDALTRREQYPDWVSGASPRSCAARGRRRRGPARRARRACIWKTSTSAPPFARAESGSCSRRRSKSRICADVRRSPLRQPREPRTGAARSPSTKNTIRSGRQSCVFI